MLYSVLGSLLPIFGSLVWVLLTLQHHAGRKAAEAAAALEGKRAWAIAEISEALARQLVTEHRYVEARTVLKERRDHLGAHGLVVLDAEVDSSTVPATLFMAQVVCPNCQIDALHDLRPALRQADLDPAAIETKAQRIRERPEFTDEKPLRPDPHWRRVWLDSGKTKGLYSAEELAEMKEVSAIEQALYGKEVKEWEDRSRSLAVRYLLDPEAHFDVMRHCNSCDHTWGQRVGVE